MDNAVNRLFMLGGELLDANALERAFVARLGILVEAASTGHRT